jgi:phenylpropionate dioxygenase-like ring-hydroxylating dioxygenase large terminal subunit
MTANQETAAAPAAMPRDCTFTCTDWEILSRYWHPVAFSHDVTSAPMSARLLDQDLVVYRSSQSVVVARDICLHRGARLTLGQIDGDELVCAYHGWRYGANGRCTRIPSQPPDIRISPKARLSATRRRSVMA